MAQETRSRDLAQEEPTGRFVEDVLDGLAQPTRQIPGKYIWDQTGSSIFETLSLQPDYYATSREMALLTENAGAIAEAIGPGACVVEFGSGASHKIRVLLDALCTPTRYVAIDISDEFVGAAAKRVQADYPSVEVIQVFADYSIPLPPLPIEDAAAVLGFFPGTSIANMEPDSAVQLLSRIKGALGANWLLIGQDPNHDRAKLAQAYGSHLMATLHENLLVRMVRELDAEIDVTAFKHQARILQNPVRVEAHLVASRATVIRVGGRRFEFTDGESIRTDVSWKFTESDFRDLATGAGWVPVHSWLDPDHLFGLHLLRAAS